VRPSPTAVLLGNLLSEMSEAYVTVTAALDTDEHDLTGDPWHRRTWTG